VRVHHYYMELEECNTITPDIRISDFDVKTETGALTVKEKKHLRYFHL